jgi:subtilisin family serine protease
MTDMSEKTAKWKEYPELISGEFDIVKSPRYFYLKVRRDLGDAELQKFLDETQDLFRFGSALAKDLKETLGLFAPSSFRDGVVVSPVNQTISVDDTIGKLEEDERVDIISPIYVRKDRAPSYFLTFEDEIIIRFDEKVEADRLQSFFREFAVEKVRVLDEDLLLLRVLNKKLQNTYEVVQRMKMTATVKIRYVHINWTQIGGTTCAIPNDTYFNDATGQWNLERIDAPGAWDISKGSPLVVIAILDCGCDLSHPDLQSQFVQGERLFDAITMTTNPSNDPANCWEKGGHGTLCAGIASAQTNAPGAEGVAGVGWNCRLMPIRMKGIDAITWEKIVSALCFARTLIADPANVPSGYMRSEKRAHVISMSWKFSGFQRDSIEEQLKQCYDAGIVMFAAAGNWGGSCPDEIGYPASSKYVIAVGASNQKDERCQPGEWTGWGGGGTHSSQYGPELSIVAPGINIRSTDITGEASKEEYEYWRDAIPLPIIYPSTHMKGGWNDIGDYADQYMGPGTPQRQGIGDIPKGDYYFEFYGTSASTPHAAGVAGLMLAYDPSLTPDQIRTILQNTAEHTGRAGENTYVIDANHPKGWNKFMGCGRLNASGALKEVQAKVQADPLYSFGPADVYIRDSLQDNGTEPYGGNPLCYSPDIIVRQNTVINPQTTFGNKSVDPGSDSVAVGKDNYIYVRVHNGTTPTNIHVRLYYAPLATTCNPDQWHYINQYDFYDVQPNTMAVSEEIVWAKADVPAPETVSHPCLIASIEGVRDPHPDPMEISAGTNYGDFIRKHNNICYRNLFFADVFAGSVIPMPFLIGGFNGNLGKIDVKILMEEDAIHAEIGLKIPAEAFQEGQPVLRNAFERTEAGLDGFRFFHKLEKDEALVRNLVIRAKEIRSYLQINIPEDALPGKSLRLSVQQLVDGKNVGDFQVICRVIDPQEAKYIGIREKMIVHQAESPILDGVDKKSWVPFRTMADAKKAGYDLAKR